MWKQHTLMRVGFLSLLALVAINIISNVLGFHLEIEKYFAIRILFTGLPVLLLTLHSFITLPRPRAIFLLAIAAFIGWIMEVWGLSANSPLNLHYLYKSNPLTLLNVPLPVILFWAIFIYTGYSIVNSLIFRRGWQKPGRGRKNLWLLPVAIILDGWVVTAIDLFMDPLQVRAGEWSWVGGGSYFGVPLGNFLVWFVITIVVTGIFRTYEYFSPIKDTKQDAVVRIIPVIGNGALAISFAVDALYHQMLNLAIIGSTLMLSVVALNLILIIKRKSFRIPQADHQSR